MALSGTIYGTTSNQYIRPMLSWSAKQSVSGNYSDVTVVLTYVRTNTGYTTEGTWVGGITIHGTRTEGRAYLVITNSSYTKAMEVTTRVYHDSDGSKTITISADGGISAASLQSTMVTGSITLDTIPRVSPHKLSATSVEFGKTITITITRAVSSFTHKLFYKYGNTGWVHIASDVGTSYTWTVPLTFMNSIPDANSLSITIGCDTYYNGSMLGTSLSEFTATVPASVLPTIKDISFTKMSSEPATWPMTQHVTRGAMAMVGVSGYYGSTIKTYSLTFAGLSSASSTLTVDNIASSGKLAAVAKVTDSRGRTATKTVEFNVSPYEKPKLTLSVYRSNASGEEDAIGEYLHVEATAEISAVGDNAVQSLTLQYKQRSYSAYTSVTLTPGTSKIVSASSNNTWDWIVTVADKVSTVSSNGSIPTGAVVFDILANGKGISFGKVAEKTGLGSGWDFDGVNITASNKLKGASVEATSAAFTNVTIGGTSVDFVKDIKDYVVDQGTSGIWTYRKWNSGIAECWGLYPILGAVINVAWGYLFETATDYQISFPTNLFTANPVAHFSTPTATGGILALETLGETTKVQTCSFFPIRATPSTLDLTVAITAIGRWK